MAADAAPFSLALPRKEMAEKADQQSHVKTI